MKQIKVLWVCNVAFADVADKLNIRTTNGGGWQKGLFDALKTAEDIKLTVCFPSNSKIVNSCTDNDINYYTFYQKTNIFGMSDFINFSPITEDNFREIFSKENPDILQIFGSEYPHCLQAVKAYNKPEKTVVHIQGLLYKIAESYYANIPRKYEKMIVPSILLRKTIYGQKIEMEKRARIEASLFKSVDNVIGRTDWDREFSLKLNPYLNYFKCSELLRNSFYSGEWTYENCKARTIFVSQGSYPIKGLHMLLRAIALVKKRVPDVKLYVAGNSPIKTNTLKGKLMISPYGVYLKELINKYDLKKNVEFLGSLSEDKMKRYLLDSNVFVLPSIIENSSNSLAEAMLVGIPCVAANTGGTPSLISDKEGFLYQFDDVEGLSNTLVNIFDELPEVLNKKSVITRKRAVEIFDKEDVSVEMRKIYDTIFSK